MKEYQKIANIYSYGNINDKNMSLTPIYKVLKDIMWEGTEKVDGTNIRVHWDGYRIEIAGRTDKAEIPAPLKEVLTSMFLTPEFENIIEGIFGDKEVFLYGEGFGPKIQKAGGLYAENPSFILFDVEVNGCSLSRENVNDVANQIGLNAVPIVFKGTLDEAIDFVAAHPVSTLGNHEHEMEGLVLQPADIQLFDRKGHPIKVKCKYCDIINQMKRYGKLINKE